METPVLNLDLLVEQTDDGFFGRVMDSPVGTAAAIFTPPFSPAELEDLARLVSAPAPAAGGSFDVLRARAEEMGTRLFDALFNGEVAQLLHRNMNYAYQQRSRLRIRLSTSETPTLMRLPWEYLRNPARDEFVALSGHAPLSRYLEVSHHVRPLPVELPLRMLVIIAGPPGFPFLDVQQEWLDLVDTIDVLGAERKLIVERMARPTLFELQRRLRTQPYHIVHFAGYTFYDRTAQEAFLILEDERGRARPVSARHISSTLHDHYSLRLVVLNARSAWQPVPLDPTLAIAHALIKRGLPAAVALPYPLADRAALAFAWDFYSRIADSAPVDVAMAEARRAMLADIAGVEWTAPILFMRVPDGRLFDPRATVTAAMPARRPTLDLLKSAREKDPK
jgi:hypothetical protein